LELRGFYNYRLGIKNKKIIFGDMLPLYHLFPPVLKVQRYKNSLQNYLTNLFLCPYLTVFNQKHLSPVSQ
jgi:hypothetical protein